MRKIIVTSQGKALLDDSKILAVQDWTLPPEYEELQYVTLRNTNIYTGEKTNKTTEIEAYVNPTATTATYLWYSDSSSSGSSNTTAYFSSSGNWRFGNRTISIANASYAGAFHTFKQDSSGVTIDGESKGTYASMSSFTSSTELKFGSSANTDNRWKYFKHAKNGELVSFYKACKRLSDNVAGFYDLIKEEFKPGGTAGPAES